MGKSVQEQLAELESRSRELNGLLKDVNRAISEAKKVVALEYGKLAQEEAAKVRDKVNAGMTQFFSSVNEYIEETKKVIDKRMGAMAAMCGADDHIMKLIAVDVLQRAGGTVEGSKGKDGRRTRYHIVLEEDHPDGSTFGFPGHTESRFSLEPNLRQAMVDAVDQFRPGLGGHVWGKRDIT